MNDEGLLVGFGRHRWPVFVAAAFVTALLLAVVWVGFEVRRVREQRALLRDLDEGTMHYEPAIPQIAQGREELARLTNGFAAETELAQWLHKMLAGRVVREIQLDVLEVAAKFPSSVITQKLAQIEVTRPKDDRLAGFRETLYGGDAEAGRKVFAVDPNAACVKCHRIGGQGGDIGPDQSDVGKRLTREEILEAILHPNARITEHFETAVVSLTNDAFYAGVVKRESDTELQIAGADVGVMTFKKAEIKSRSQGLSLMPEGLGQVLPKRDIRNLIEFLARQQSPPTIAAPTVGTNRMPATRYE